jgi:uncharacterized OB-fold protein
MSALLADGDPLQSYATGIPSSTTMTAVDDERATAVLDEALIAVGPAGPALRGWRCNSCGRLAFGIKRRCPTCGARDGRETRLESVGVLETWTRVFGQTEYVIGYAQVGDGEDEQRVRVFAPIDVADESELESGRPVELRFKVGTTVWGEERLHHSFAPGG